VDAITKVPEAVNEPVLSYGPGSPERGAVQRRLDQMLSESALDLPQYINGDWVPAAGDPFDVVQPHLHDHVLGVGRESQRADAADAIRGNLAAAHDWRALDFDSRAAVFLKAADLLAGPYRETLNSATMLGQSKTVFQAEIDAACELIDFLRFNVSFARQILAEQPQSSPGVWNRTDHRPLEGFVYAITPFNFTAIAGNLPTAPALMGNVVLWKPAPTQMFAAHFWMKILIEAGLPPGVINMVTGSGIPVSEVALHHPDLAGIHFTGSTPTFQNLWRSVGNNIGNYRSYPRIVGETGGKDFIFALPSADPEVLTTAMIRGAFEFQGQKCSAASRAYVPRSVWNRIRDDLVSQTESLAMGSPVDFHNFLCAVIDRRSYDKLAAVLGAVADDDDVNVLAGGGCDDSRGFFVEPTIMEVKDPFHDHFQVEYFGPVLAVHVYEDADLDRVMHQMESVAPYALTGAVIGNDREAVAAASERLRFAAGNFYINDKPTGAVVGQQPFGGGRASGTNDKAGAAQNLLRWTSTRSIKETFVPPTSYRYPYMG